jgi:hypothetical protein
VKLREGIVRACGAAGLAAVLLLTGAVEGYALGAGMEIGAEYDQPLPMSLFRNKNADRPVKNQPIFRTNGEYEWKWINKGNGYSRLISDGNGTFYYYDYSNIVHAVTSENEQVWMSEPFPQKIVSLSRMDNDNLLLILNPEITAINVIGSSIKPTTTDRVIVYDKEGKKLLDQWLLNPNVGGANLLTAGGRIVFQSEEGLVCYDTNGRKLWTITDNVRLTRDEGKQWYTNVDALERREDGAAALFTSDGVYRLIDASGNIVDVQKARKTKLQTGERNFLIVTQGEDGLYWWGEERLTAEEMIAVHNNRPKRPYWTQYDLKWAQGSYSTTEEENNLVAKDLDGNVRWTYYTPEAQYGHPSDVIVNRDGDVFFSDNGGNIYGLDSEGNEIFRLIRNNRDMTSVQLSLTPDGGVLGTTEDIGMFRIARSGIAVTIEGKLISPESQPFLQEGEVFVPFGPVLERLGFDVQWNDAAQTIVGTKPGTNIRLQIGQPDGNVNGQALPLTIAPQMIDGTPFVPARFVGEALGLQVEWDAVNREVRIGSPEQLARQAVFRFLKHVEQGDDHKATADLTDSELSLFERVPSLVPAFVRKQWRSDIVSMTARSDGPDYYVVEAVQRNRSFDFKQILDKVGTWRYVLKRTPEGIWKIEDSDLFQGKPIF